ncbi:MAG: penicillin-binding protein 2 [bacterium]
MLGRFRFLSIVIIFGFGALLARLFTLQVVYAHKYRALAKEQHSRSGNLPAPRGSIYSSDNFPLTLDETSYLLYAEPKVIEDPQEIALALSKLINRDYSELLESLGPSDLWWIKLADGLDLTLKKQIESLSFSGLGFEAKTTRFYPENDLALEVLGFVGKDQDDNPQGYFGLEGYYNEDLTGRSGRITQDVSALGEPILSGFYNQVSALAGRDLVLTLNRDMQFLVELRLKKAMSDFGAKSGDVVILEPETGAILTMASYPKQASPSAFANNTIGETYEPGSVMKAVTMSAAINEGVVEPQTTMQDSGPVVYSGHTVDNWDGKHHGEETMVEILQHSNNIGAAWVGGKLGAKTLREYFLKFGFGEKLGLDLEGEGTGVVRPLSEWGDIDLATAAFGQGISVTPLQMASALATIANGGVYQKPYIVGAIRDSGANEKSYLVKPAKGVRVLKKAKAEVITEMLTQAVSGGEGKFAVLKNYKISGKTGTAQIPIDGKYDPQKTNATFIGFLPNSRKFVMLVRLCEPQSSLWASETAEPLWMDIAQDLIRYYGIEPDY